MHENSNKSYWGGYAYTLISLIMATITVFRVYPFIGLADGFTRWELAMEICSYGHIVSETLLSPIIPYIQAFTYRITGSFGFYTWLQCAGFYLCSGVLINMLLPNQHVHIIKLDMPVWFLISVVMLFIPTVRIFPVLLTDSAPIYILIVIFIKINTLEFIKHKWMIFLIGTLVVFLTVAIRVNSLLMFVGLWVICAVCFLRKKEIKYVFLQTYICVGMLLGIMVPRFLVPASYNAATLSMVWEMVGMVKEYEIEDLEDALSSFGNVNEAVERYGEPYLNSIVWDNSPPFPAKEIAGEYSGDIMKLYIKTVFEYPFQYLKLKWEFACNSLGIGNRLISSGRGIHYVDDKTMSYGAVSTDIQSEERTKFITFTDKIGIVSLRPIIMMLVTLVLMGIVKRFMDVDNYVFICLVAILYYSSFLINTQAFEFRYYAPTFFILLMAATCAIVRIIYGFLYKITNFRKKVEKE